MHLFRVFGVAARARDSKGNKPKKTILLRRERSRARRHDEKEDKTKKKTILLRSFFYTNRHTAHVRLRALEFPHQKAPVQSAMAAFRVAWSWCSKSVNGRHAHDATRGCAPSRALTGRRSGRVPRPRPRKRLPSNRSHRTASSRHRRSAAESRPERRPARAPVPGDARRRPDAHAVRAMTRLFHGDCHRR